MEMVDGPPMTSEWALCAFLWQGTLDAVAMCDVPHVLPASAGGRARGLLRRLREFAGSAATGDACATAALHATGFDLLGVLLEHAERPTLAPIDEELARVLPAVRYAQEHLTERLTRRALADEAHLSESRFHDVFSRALRMAPLEYVMHLRIQRARELLLATDLPVYAVAERCGFNSPHYFSRAFAARAGVPPGRYRESTCLG
jgi:AraC-like DNA-binding protein